METKKWYQSREIWSNIVTIIVALTSALSVAGMVPADIAVKITAFVGSLAGAFGIYSRNTSDGKKVG
ncbi:hypothetical protein C0389_06865 [bacterium]|nr:hypothetical protein [bacterium]